jgi:ribonuclease P protein component
MLSSTRRISKTEFKSLGRGQGFHSPLMSLFVYKKPTATASQFAFLTSKKISKSAVVRNTLRRRGYVAVKSVLKTVVSGYYFVFNFKKGSEKALFSEISDTVIQLLKPFQSM